MQRPRLADRILARRQERDGQTIVALHDPGRTIRVVGAREWTVLACADGTRDLEGIAAAAARHGVQVTPQSVAAFLAMLAELGWMVDGAPAELLVGRIEAKHRTASERPIVAMPQVAIACDGRGGCCRAYATVMFLPRDVIAARAAVPERESAGDALFLPVHGSAPSVTQAVGLCEGACAYLEPDGRCSIHARAGAGQKPLGCRWYPTQLVDDGVQVRAAPVIECACAARPVAGGDPLVPSGVATAGDLPVGMAVERVPDRVAIASRFEVDRAQACALLDRIAALALPGDAIAWLWSLADRLERDGLAADLAAVDPPAALALADACARWGRRAAERCAAETVWRSPDDAVCLRLRTIAGAGALLSAPVAAQALLSAAPDDPELEAHVVRAGAWGRAWILGAPLAEVIREHAIAMALARAMAAFVPLSADGTLRSTPLAAVLAVRRTCP